MPDEHGGMTEAEMNALISGGGNKPPYNPKKHGEGAAAGCLLYMEERTPFKTGDIVRQRIGLCTNPREAHNLSWGFLKYLDEKDRFTIKGPEYFEVDCVIAQLDVEGDSHFMCTDSRRLELYPQEDLDRLGAEAAKAIN